VLVVDLVQVDGADWLEFGKCVDGKGPLVLGSDGTVVPVDLLIESRRGSSLREVLRSFEVADPGVVKRDKIPPQGTQGHAFPSDCDDRLRCGHGRGRLLDVAAEPHHR